MPQTDRWNENTEPKYAEYVAHGLQPRYHDNGEYSITAPASVVADVNYRVIEERGEALFPLGLTVLFFGVCAVEGLIHALAK